MSFGAFYNYPYAFNTDSNEISFEIKLNYFPLVNSYAIFSQRKSKNFCVSSYIYTPDVFVFCADSERLSFFYYFIRMKTT